MINPTIHIQIVSYSNIVFLQIYKKYIYNIYKYKIHVRFIYVCAYTRIYVYMQKDRNWGYFKIYNDRRATEMAACLWQSLSVGHPSINTYFLLVPHFSEVHVYFHLYYFLLFIYYIFIVEKIKQYNENQQKYRDMRRVHRDNHGQHLDEYFIDFCFQSTKILDIFSS